MLIIGREENREGCDLHGRDGSLGTREGLQSRERLEEALEVPKNEKSSPSAHAPTYPAEGEKKNKGWETHGLLDIPTVKRSGEDGLALERRRDGNDVGAVGEVVRLAEKLELAHDRLELSLHPRLVVCCG